MKKLWTHLLLLFSAILCLTGVAFAADEGEPLNVAPEFHLTKVTSTMSSTENRTISYEYDDNGNLLYQHIYYFHPEGYENYDYEKNSTYTYDDSGNMTASTVITTYPGGESIKEKTEEQYSYRQSGTLEFSETTYTSYEKTGESQYTRTYKDYYDESGTLLKEEYSSSDSSPTITIFTYENGLLTEESTNDHDYGYKYFYTLDDKGRILKKDVYSYSASTLTEVTDDFKSQFRSDATFSINENGNVVVSYLDSEEEQSYDSNGNVVSHFYAYYGSISELPNVKGRWKKTYDENNLLIKEEAIADDGSILQTNIYKYDEYKNHISTEIIYNSGNVQTINFEYEQYKEFETPDPVPSSPFVDVQDPNSYCYDAVLWAVENGVTNGYDETHFLPNRSCTRAQIVTFLWRAAGSPEPSSNNNPFTDVKDGPYYKAILWAVEKGITKGTTATTFAPNAACTRAQIVTFIYRAAGEPQIQNSTNPFTDVKGGAYYKAILWAVDSGITKGTTATTFAPSATCTRGQGVTFLYRADDLLQ